MVDKDQNIRRILVDSIGLDSSDAGLYMNRMIEIDSENQKKFILLILNTNIGKIKHYGKLWIYKNNNLKLHFYSVLG